MTASTPILQKLTELTVLISRLLRKSFGRGPDSCNAYANQRYLVFYIRGFMSPMEAVLLEHGSVEQINFSRSIVMKSVLGQLRGVLEMDLEQDVQNFYHDWNYDKNTGVIIVVFETDITPGDESEDFSICNPLIDEIERISVLVQKLPERTEVYQISPKLYLVKRIGILIPLEKALIAKGYRQILLDTMEDLEKSYYGSDKGFEAIFKQPIADIFVDWNLNEDNSIICFMLR